ncbi:LCP family protein [Prauserella muralis]|uniref:LytR family transcriptional regulator n=1 Tax=Prauserella muralis TaxID=588067 RepID=A0A2V4BFJ8_9PSEU|nr:LCP family protein [Prauserella muralis]PXY32829.1 LytR family transcriptional regulator [Prauserella muralis]
MASSAVPTPYPRSSGTGDGEAPDSEDGDGDAGRPGEQAGDAPPRRRRRSPVRAAARTLIALLSVVALAATGYAYATLDQLQDNVQTTDALTYDDHGDDEEGTPPPPKDDGATDILLVGADSRTDMQGNPLPLSMLKQLRTESKEGINTDTLIVLRIPKDGSAPSAVSIPRDTWVDVPQGGRDKINSAYGAAKVAEAQRLRAEGRTDSAAISRESDQAGRRALVKTVQDFTQVSIDHYAEIGLLGFYLLTEALGGVEVCLNHATEDKDSGADFAAGPQVVSGGEALSFVRQRKNLPRGDLDRIVRQQAFLASALNKVLSAGTLTNPGKLSQLTETVRRSLVMDPDLDLLQFAEQAKDIASGKIRFVTIPVVQVGARSADGQSIITVDTGQVRSFLRNLVNRDLPPPAAGGGGSAPAAGASAPITADGVPCVN